MRSVSGAFYDAIKNDRRDYLERVTMTLTDSTVLNITNEHIWQNGLSWEDAVSDENSFQLGAVIINKATIVLNNIYGDFDDYDFVGASVVIELGLSLSGTDEYIKIGTYTVIDEPKWNGSFITIECLDNMYKFDRPYSQSTLVYPAYTHEVIADACSHCGVTFNRIDGESGYSEYLLLKPVSDKLTFRQVLSYAVQVSGNDFARCNPDGELVISHYYRLGVKNAWGSAQLTDYPPHYPYSETTKTVSGITFTDNGDGTITVNGTNTSSSAVSFTISNLYSGNDFKYGKYKVSGCPSGSTYSNYYMRITVGNSTGSGAIYTVTENGRTVTLSGTNTSIPSMSIVVGAGITVNNAVFSPKIEREDGGIPEISSIQYLTDLFNYNIANKDTEYTGARVFADFTDDDGVKHKYDVSRGTDDCEVVVANNPLIQNTGVSDTINMLAAGHIGMIYRKADITHGSNPTIEAGDLGVVVDRKGNRYPVIISSTKFTVGDTQKTISAADDRTVIESDQRPTTVSQAVYNLGNEKVSRAGDTMTGNLTMQKSNPTAVYKSTNLDSAVGETVPEDDTSFGGIQFSDMQGVTIGWVKAYKNENDRTYVQIVERRIVGGDTIFNSLSLGINADGSRSVSVSEAAVWRSALGINNTVGVKSASGVTVTTGTTTTIANTGSLSAGTYVIRGYVSFPSNATGRRTIMLASSDTATSPYNGMLASNNAVTGGAGTYMNVFGVLTLTSALTLYLRAYQNSGSDLSCSGRIEVLKIH